MASTRFQALSSIIRSADIQAILKIIRFNFGIVDAAILLTSGVIFYVLLRHIGRRRSTRLQGPCTSNIFLGVIPQLMNALDSGDLYEIWAAQFGSVFSIPTILGSRRIVITDPKSIAHLAARETYGYVGTPQARRLLVKILGKGLLWAEGDSHKRQRRALNPAFTNAAVRNLIPIFFDAAYKTKAAWDSLLESGPSEGAIIEVQQWMNHISFDTIGLAGFSHDFGTLAGKKSSIIAALDTIGSNTSFLDTVAAMFSSIVPILDLIPTRRRFILDEVARSMWGLGDNFLATTGEVGTDKSMMGLLVESTRADKISREEVASQINLLLFAAYETTSISLTWALIELARDPVVQKKLRDELLRSGGDPTWEELTDHGSLLDAFTCEVLRIHPPFPELHRMAAEDDILPLSKPIKNARGELIDCVFVSKGTVVTLPIQCINRSEAFWGSDAKVFNPARWLDESPGFNQLRAQEIQGYRHLLTFSDGARICLGKVFAVAEFKAVLSVLLRNFTFELPKGPTTAIGYYRNLLPRPKVEGEAGYDVPLKVRHYVASG
ncbi:cytochrome P450 [Mycena albidolilacea]|uniref:Cytochrome P450 n=1 Tax=Mycena albidolilacea TaxID=1033008 RepID=A0AAD7A8D2_9AGAR|nr:cytochrome P450 [Mycena albidolilacea]